MKTLIILDLDLLNKSIEELDVSLDYGEFLVFLKSLHEESRVQTAYAYTGINFKSPHLKDKMIDDLWKKGFIVRKVKGENYGINFISDSTSAIILDVLRHVYENNVTNVVIVSNSNKLIDLVVLLREKDVYVETVYYGSKCDYDLAVKSNGFIDLDEFIGDEDVLEENEINLYQIVELKNNDDIEENINNGKVQQDEDNDDFIEIKTIKDEVQQDNNEVKKEEGINNETDEF